MAGKKVALVHDYLVQDGGAERVLAALQNMFPDAPTYVLIYDKRRANPQFATRDIRPSFLDAWPFMRRHYQWTLPLMPMAIEQFDLRGYDVVISSSITFGKGIIVPPETLHVCYCHTPSRFLWHDRIGYVEELPKARIVRKFLPPILHGIRGWDRLAAERPDMLATNSETSRRRIQRYYHRDATVIPPPVDVDRIPFSREPGAYWLAGGRLVPYKRFDIIVRAFAKLDIPLKIFGVGPEAKKLKALAGKQTQFVGRVSDEEKFKLYAGAIAFLNPQDEDFGITAVEAMAAGKPVVTFGRGGGAETVVNGVTGTHIEAQTWADIGDEVIRFDPSRFDPVRIRARAEEFAAPRFAERLRAFVSQQTHGHLG